MASTYELLALVAEETEAIWLQEFQRVAGPDATLSEDSQTALHIFRTIVQGIVTFDTRTMARETIESDGMVSLAMLLHARLEPDRPLRDLFS